MTTYSLISIDHITQLIPALAAFEYEQSKNLSMQKQLLVFTKPHLVFDSIKIDHIQALLSTQPNAVLMIGDTLFQHSKLLSKLPVRTRVLPLRKALKDYTILDIYYSHDISSDFWNQALMQALPKAKRICYGDALGLVYTQSYFTQLMYQIYDQKKLLIHNILARIKRYFLFPSKRKQLQADEAILAIPCDPGGDFLPNCKLTMLKKEALQSCVKNLAEKIPEYRRHMQELVSGGVDCYLLMLSNFTESKLTSLEHEIALYQDILAIHAQKNSIVILKPHPAHQPDCFNAIVHHLSQEYQIKVIDPQFYHLPIELAETLVQQCTILSLSYSSISLPYIYAKQVSHVLTQELINKHFSPEKMNWFSQSNDLYLNLIESLGVKS